MSKNFLKFGFIMLAMVLLGAACGVKEPGEPPVKEEDTATSSSPSLLDKILNTLENSFDKAQKGATKAVKEAGDNFAKNLSPEQKEIVENWLKRNQLNEYGDSAGTFYTSCTPFFN